MNKSPGHLHFPNHRVEERRVAERMTVAVGGEVIADSADVICVDEDKSMRRYYFPRSDVRAQLLPSGTTTECPFKGTATYFSLIVGPQKLHDVVWTYEHPYDEHRALRGRLAFYAENIPDLQIRTD